MSRIIPNTQRRLFIVIIALVFSITAPAGAAYVDPACSGEKINSPSISITPNSSITVSKTTNWEKLMGTLDDDCKARCFYTRSSGKSYLCRALPDPTIETSFSTVKSIIQYKCGIPEVKALWISCGNEAAD